MIYSNDSDGLSRRDFFKLLVMSGYLLHNPVRTLFAKDEIKSIPQLKYKYKTMSVKHLSELQKDMDKVLTSGKVSNNELFQSYIKERKFQLREDFPEAKTVIVVAVFTNNAVVNFIHGGKKYETSIPPQYWDNGLTMKHLKSTVQKDIIKKTGYKLESTTGFFMKRLATRTGLGKYGRNNICYVDEFGTFITLFGFFTDWESKEDHWTEVKQLDLCDNCDICLKKCPTNAILENEFVINVDKCVTLYNEGEGKFPDWIQHDAHNALMGCMRCQEDCPYNSKVMKTPVMLPDITETETELILSGKYDEKVMKNVSEKLKNYYPATSDKYLSIFTRNLKVLL